MFDTKAGLFGTEGWLKYVQDIYNNPSKFGLPEKSNVKEISGHITKTFDDILAFYNELDVKYKPLFAPFINRSSFQNILKNGYELPTGGFMVHRKKVIKRFLTGHSI